MGGPPRSSHQQLGDQSASKHSRRYNCHTFVSGLRVFFFLEMKAAVQSSQNAYESWKNTSVLTRQQLMLKLQAVIRRDMKKIAANITLEQGKTLADADGDVLRGVREY